MSNPPTVNDVDAQARTQNPPGSSWMDELERDHDETINMDMDTTTLSVTSLVHISPRPFQDYHCINVMIGWL